MAFKKYDEVTGIRNKDGIVMTTEADHHVALVVDGSLNPFDNRMFFRLSPAEARELAAALNHYAKEAEKSV